MEVIRKSGQQDSVASQPSKRNVSQQTLSLRHSPDGPSKVPSRENEEDRTHGKRRSTTTTTSAARGGGGGGGAAAADDDRSSSASNVDDRSSVYRAPFIRSLFSKTPPKLNFVGDGQKVRPLPTEIQKLLRWKISAVTPLIVLRCLVRSGFKVTLEDDEEWLGFWGYLQPPGFIAVHHYQKVNHFPGTYELARKDCLHRNVSRMRKLFGKEKFDFIPKTFILPDETSELKSAFRKFRRKRAWIVKPRASSNGRGIQMAVKWRDIPVDQMVIVQRYITRPHLINKKKFDLMVYVNVTSFNPLRIYLYTDGVARFASANYSHSAKGFHNHYIHITNYNAQNHSSESKTDELRQEVMRQHNWSMKSIFWHLKNEGIDCSLIWSQIVDLVIKTIISVEWGVCRRVEDQVKCRYSCHELLGFDILLDEDLKAWLIEVNKLPALHSFASVFSEVSGRLVRDCLNLAGFMIPNIKDLHPVPRDSTSSEQSNCSLSNDVCRDQRLWTREKSRDEEAKHRYYVKRHENKEALSTILNTLTPDDIRILTETVDEFNRRGEFVRAFPTSTTHLYHKYFDEPRYYNLLLHAWCKKYYNNEQAGISLLESFCQRGIHLQNPTSDPNHQWRRVRNDNDPAAVVSSSRRRRRRRPQGSALKTTH